MKTVNHTPSNLRIAAMLKRDALAAAAAAWMATEPGDDEADIALEAALLSTGTIDPDDQVYEIWSDAPETLMVRVNGSTLIEIDVESGCSARGEVDAPESPSTAYADRGLEDRTRPIREADQFAGMTDEQIAAYFAADTGVMK